MIRIAIVGAGTMASVRTRALLDTGLVELCGIASYRAESANKFANDFNISYATTDYRHLIAQKPDAILVELPHKVQDDVVMWALQEKLHVLLGGCLSTTSAIGEKIVALCEENKVIVECGYEARYKPCWHYIKQQLERRLIGTPCVVNAIALWNAPTDSWYYNQVASGGMPVTHISYAFINPLRWLFGEPLQLSAMSNKVKETDHDCVHEESCVINIRFPNNLLVSLTAGYITAPEKVHWQLEILGTSGMLEIHPGDLDSGLVRHYSEESGIITLDFSDFENAFNRQAHIFIDEIKNLGNDKKKALLNPPHIAINDIRIAEAIVQSSKNNETIFF
ncbi:MAG: Gfo/Idh/MocA family oxidoreductase [Thiohalomonas sp.]|nr:Gfo/Idh/MocA family oxidoreductase [Thiohalomonas sp.]